MKIVLGTRGSALALAQAELAQVLLLQVPGVDSVERQVIKTTGDRRLDLRLSDSGKKFERGLFTKELEEALFRGEIDVAVHSLKDLPIELPRELMIAAVLPREDPSDVLISRQASSLNEIGQGGIVATSSPRRAHQVQRWRPDLKIVEVRGNVPTRLEKLITERNWDGLILARAGLERLSLKIQAGRIQFRSDELFASILEGMLPAAGQGAIALEVQENSLAVRDLLQSVNDSESWFCVQAEREFLRLLGGGCGVPIGVRACIRQRKTAGEPLIGKHAELEAIVFEGSGSVKTGSVAGNFGSPQLAAQTLFQTIYGNGR
jgi:hydroxymethylbilane synthase